MARSRHSTGTPPGVHRSQRIRALLPLRFRERLEGVLATASLGLALLAPPPAAAQALPPLAEGFARTEVLRETGYAFGFAGFAPDGVPGAMFFAVGHAVYHRDPQGIVRLVHAFPVQDRCEILVRDPARGTLLFADDRSGQLQVLDTQTGIQTARGLPLRTFDLVVLPSGQILASANPLWPAPGAHPGIWLVDPTGGNNHREVVQLGPGASGPLALHPDRGDLYYATASASYPTPPGSVRVLEFGAAAVAAAIAGGPALGPANASALPARLDGAFDIAFDDRGRLFASNPQDGRVEVVRADGTLDPVPLCGAQPGTSSLGLCFADDGPATMAGYQPGEGARLWVATNDWATLAAVHEIRAARPVATSASGPAATAGNLRIDASGLPRSSLGVLAFNILPALPSEMPLLVGLPDVPCWWGLDPQMPLLTVACTTDALGHTQVPLPYRGGLSWTLSIQLAVPTLDQTLCSTRPLTITLIP